VSCRVVMGGFFVGFAWTKIVFPTTEKLQFSFSSLLWSYLPSFYSLTLLIPLTVNLIETSYLLSIKQFLMLLLCPISRSPSLTPTESRDSFQSLFNSQNSELSPLISRKRQSSERRTRKVAFSKSLESCTQTTLNLTDYSSDEKAATWYNGKDCYSFRQHCQETVHKLRRGRQVAGYTIRGLEGSAGEGHRQRCGMIREGIKAVLDEQALQWLDDRKKPEMLAHIYRRYARLSQMKANKRGLQDQQEVLAA
jgi:hypothetical protein